MPTLIEKLQNLNVAQADALLRSSHSEITPEAIRLVISKHINPDNNTCAAYRLILDYSRYFDAIFGFPFSSKQGLKLLNSDTHNSTRSFRRLRTFHAAELLRGCPRLAFEKTIERRQAVIADF